MVIPLVGPIARGLDGMIGLGQEAYHHNKDKKEAAAAAAAAQRNLQPEHSLPTHPTEDGLPADPPPSYDEIEDDEDDWLADDAQAQIALDNDDKKQAHAEITLDDDDKHTHAQVEVQSPDKTIQWFLSRHPTPANFSAVATATLPGPVVVPQRRPNARTRGFVRAYAPALEAAGVDQAAFLDFLLGFDKSTSSQSWFNVTNLAVALSVLSYTASLGPSITVHLSAMAVHASIETGRRLYISKKENSYLDEMNEKFWRPRGMYAMIMAYIPSTPSSSVQLDFDATSALAVGQHASGTSTLGSLKASSGQTGDHLLPPICPLLYPTLSSSSAEQQRNAFMRSLAFAADYYDRRSRAQFAAKHPDSGLAGAQPPPAFRGSHADPAAHANSGILGVVTGGKLDPYRRRYEGRNARQRGRGRPERVPGGGGSREKAPGLVKRTLGDNVLYLMIVNMPSEEELEAARGMEEKMKAEKPNWFEQFGRSISRQ